MLPREKGSNEPKHDIADPRCVKAVTTYADESHTCEVCAIGVTREQAAAAINHRELGS